MKNVLYHYIVFLYSIHFKKISLYSFFYIQFILKKYHYIVFLYSIHFKKYHYIVFFIFNSFYL
jgi:hypothetical protein